jgi:hypothetical protein
MDAALIAVLGTLGGVVITAAAGLATAALTARNQRALAEAQAQREQRRAELVDCRTDFGKFLQAYDEVFAGTEVIFARASGGETGINYESELFDQVRRLKQAHLLLMITTPEQVRTASGRCLGSMWDFLDAAVTGNEERYLEAARATQQPRDAIRAAMRAHLGVMDEPTAKVAPA